MIDVFISYARAEHDVALVLKERIEAMGLTVFFDVEGLDGGDVFPDILDQAVKSAGAVVGVWSPHSLSRPWVKTECLIGKDRRVLIPVVVEPVAPLDVPAAFYGIQTIDLTEDIHQADGPGYRALARALARTLKRPDIAKPPQRNPSRPRAEPEPANQIEIGVGTFRIGARFDPKTAPKTMSRAEREKVFLAKAPDMATSSLTVWAVAIAALILGLSFDVNGFGEYYVSWNVIPLIAPLVIGWALLSGEWTYSPERWNPLTLKEPERTLRWPVALAATLLAIGIDFNDTAQFGGLIGLAFAAVYAALTETGGDRPGAWPGLALIAAGSVMFFTLEAPGGPYVFLSPLSTDLIAGGVGLLGASQIRLLPAAALTTAALAPGLVVSLGGFSGTVLGETSFSHLELSGEVGLATIPLVLIALVIVRLALETESFNKIFAVLLLTAGWLMVADGGMVLRPLLESIAALTSQTADAQSIDEIVVFRRARADWTPWWVLIAAVSVATGRLAGRHAWSLAIIAVPLLVSARAAANQEIALGLGVSASLLILAGGWWSRRPRNVEA